VSAPPPHLSDAQKRELIKRALAGDFNLRGDHLAVLSKVIDGIGHVDDALTLAEVVGLIAEGGVLSAVSTGTSFASAVLFPVGGWIEIVNAWEAGQRLAGFVAVAYAQTAWAFDDPIPGLPTRLQENITRSGLAKEIPAYRKAWQDASDSALKKLNEEAAKRPGVSKRSFQLLFRAVGDNNRQVLCRLLLKGFDNKVNTAEKMILKENEYPN